MEEYKRSQMAKWSKALVFYHAEGCFCYVFAPECIYFYCSMNILSRDKIGIILIQIHPYDSRQKNYMLAV